MFKNWKKKKKIANVVYFIISFGFPSQLSHPPTIETFGECMRIFKQMLSICIEFGRNSINFSCSYTIWRAVYFFLKQHAKMFRRKSFDIYTDIMCVPLSACRYTWYACEMWTYEHSMRWVSFVLVERNTSFSWHSFLCVSLCVFWLFPLFNFWIGDKMNIINHKHCIILWTQHIQCTTMCLNNVKCD